MKVHVRVLSAEDVIREEVYEVPAYVTTVEVDTMSDVRLRFLAEGKTPDVRSVAVPNGPKG